MAIRIITGDHDPLFNEYEDRFFNNFSSDDWDYIIIGNNEGEAYDIACKLYVFDMILKEIDGEWIGVTYHA